MTRSSDLQKAERINAAAEFLARHERQAEAAVALVRTFGISKRQAYRYLQEAPARGGTIAVPDAKVAFTVKLPHGLVNDLRRHAQRSGESLCAVVTQALEVFLRRQRRDGGRTLPAVERAPGVRL